MNTSQPSGRDTSFSLAPSSGGASNSLVAAGPSLSSSTGRRPGNSSIVSWATFFAWSASLPDTSGDQQQAGSPQQVVGLGRAGALLAGGPQLAAHPGQGLDGVAAASGGLASHALDLAGQAGDVGLGHRRRLVLGQRGDGFALLHRPLRVLAESVGQRRHQRRVGILTAAHRDRQHHQTGGRVGRPGQGDESETEHRELGQATVGGHRQQEYSFAGREKD